jgi:hypothetical protein
MCPIDLTSTLCFRNGANARNKIEAFFCFAQKSSLLAIRDGQRWWKLRLNKRERQCWEAKKWRLIRRERARVEVLTERVGET